MHDHYAKGPDGKDTTLDATIFSYKCECGLSFSFEIKLRRPGAPSYPRFVAVDSLCLALGFSLPLGRIAPQVMQADV